jgi:hypothetical protein
MAYRESVLRHFKWMERMERKGCDRSLLTSSIEELIEYERPPESLRDPRIDRLLFQT